MNFEALCDKARGVILSTDIGPDCDDVGAIALLHLYSKKYGFPILGMINCTTNDNGTKTLYALNKQVGCFDIPLGRWSGEPLFEKPESSNYTAQIAETFGAEAPDAEDSTALYRRLLSSAEDDGVIIITIGMLTDLSDLLKSAADDLSELSGVELVRRKVHAVVTMATRDLEREFNIRCAPLAARCALDLLPCDVYISDFELSRAIITGFDPSADRRDNPYYEAYRLYPHYAPLKNASWDLTTVQFAVLGEGDLYGIGERGHLRFFEAEKSPVGVADATEFIPDEEGKVIMITKRSSNEDLVTSIEDELEKILEY